MITLIIDRQVPYLGSTGGSGSLLTLPVAARSYLDHIGTRVAGIAEDKLLVVPAFSCGPDYEREIRGATELPASVIPPDRLSAALREYEPSDYVLVVDAGWWTADDRAFNGPMRGCAEYRGVTHVVAIGARSEDTRERTERDGNGQIKRIQRFYNKVTWPEVPAAAVLFSVASAPDIGAVSFESLANLRVALSVRGVLSRDVPSRTEPIDMCDESGLLALNETMVARAFAAPPSGFSVIRPDVMIGRGCLIDASARLVGPIIMHNDVVVEEGATIVGPTVVGGGSRIGRRALIARSVIAPGTFVEDGRVVPNRVACSGFPAAPAKTNGRSGKASNGSRLPIDRQHEVERLMARARPGRVRRAVHLAAKRTMDVALALVALVLLSPLLILVAIMIKLDSRGPILFVHRREQKGGKDFPCLKFRTMAADAEQKQRELYAQSEVDGPQFKIRKDPRVTRLGDFLRKSNIDELPQLLNVLVGHMSFVGPRPSPFRENQICVPWRRARLSVRPGITGLWQLCRHDREGGDFHQWIYYDIAYVRNISVWLDVKILVATVLTLGGRWNVRLSWFVRDQDETDEQIPVSVSGGKASLS